MAARRGWRADEGRRCKSSPGSGLVCVGDQQNKTGKVFLGRISPRQQQDGLQFIRARERVHHGLLGEARQSPVDASAKKKTGGRATGKQTEGRRCEGCSETAKLLATEVLDSGWCVAARLAGADASRRRKRDVAGRTWPELERMKRQRRLRVC